MLKQKRQTWYAIKCSGHVVGVVASYYSMEKEPGDLLLSASKALHLTGHDCLVKRERQRGVPCEELTVEALLSEEDQ